VVEPEDARIEELLALVRKGDADEAVAEELALYAEDRPELADRVAAAVKRGKLGKGWLVRIEADRALQARERRPAVVVERGIGLGLAGIGWLVSIGAPVIGGVMLAAGIGLLGWSFIRTRLATWKQDPYSDVEK
jgi:hypothetical protein